MKLSRSIEFYALSVTFLLIICISHTLQSITTKVRSDVRCHMLNIKNCNASIYDILDYEEAGWFYHAPFRSCRPFYAPVGSKCQQNKDLPSTKKECEDICGHNCTLPDGTQGLCMLEGSCHIKTPATYDPRRYCIAYNVQCCPRE